MQSDADAAAFAEHARPHLTDLERYVERYTVHARESTLVVDIAITEAQIETFAAMMKPLMGSLGTN
jgi:hypothetical protein